jgi:hypothetical protein
VILYFLKTDSPWLKNLFRFQDEDNPIYAFPGEGTPDGPHPEPFPCRQNFHFSHHKRIGKLAKPIFQQTCQDNAM